MALSNKEITYSTLSATVAATIFMPALAPFALLGMAGAAIIAGTRPVDDKPKHQPELKRKDNSTPKPLSKEQFRNQVVAAKQRRNKI